MFQVLFQSVCAIVGTGTICFAGYCDYKDWKDQ